MWTPTIYVDAALMLGTVSFEGLRASVRHACASEQHGATELATSDDADRHMLFPY